MKKIAVILTVLLVFMSECAAQPDKDGTILNLDASGEIEVEPDMARFRVMVSCIEKHSSASKFCLKNEIDEVFDILSELYIGPKDYHSSKVSLDKEYQWENKIRVFTGYRSSMSISVTVRDLEKLGDLLGRLMEQKNLSISGLSYSHSKTEQLKIDAHLKALDNAQRLAESIKNQIGGKTLYIMEITDTGSPVRPLSEAKSLRAAAAGSPSGEPLNVHIGTLVFRKSIRVKYRILK